MEQFLTFFNHLFIVSQKRLSSVRMQPTEKNIRIIRDKLSRIGIGERKMDNATLLASYTINKFGQLSAVPKVTPPVQ